MTLMDRNKITKHHFKQAKKLIDARKYYEAKTLLKKVDHPKADEWIEKIRKIERQLRYNVFKRIGLLLLVALVTWVSMSIIQYQRKSLLYQESDIIDAKTILRVFCEAQLDESEAYCDNWVNIALVDSNNNHAHASNILECDNDYGWFRDAVSFFECIIEFKPIPHPFG